MADSSDSENSMQRFHLGWLCLLLGILSAGGAAPKGAAKQSESPATLLKTLREVDREGKGNRAATHAWAELTAQASADQLPVILAAIDGSGPLAANWLRAAVDTVAERQIERDGK